MSNVENQFEKNGQSPKCDCKCACSSPKQLLKEAKEAKEKQGKPAEEAPKPS